MSPDKVELNAKIVMVSAGDSHTAALSDQGHVYIWGTFRVSYFELLDNFRFLVSSIPAASQYLLILITEVHGLKVRLVVSGSEVAFLEDSCNIVSVNMCMKKHNFRGKNVYFQTLI
jgi:alpha-tubulin suppressor-like RCC1 family protein